MNINAVARDINALARGVNHNVAGIDTDSGIIDLTGSDDDETEIYEYQHRNRQLVVYTSDEESGRTYGPDPTEPMNCPVCINTIANRDPHLLRPCKHFICSDCLDNMIHYSYGQNHRSRCPLCQTNLNLFESERVYM